MRGTTPRALARTAAACLVVAALTSGCGSGPVEPVTSDSWVAGSEPPTYCSPGTEPDADASFWAVVHDSCGIAQDGDLVQAEALRQALDELRTDHIAEFHATLVRLNRELSAADPVADDICAPGLGLGDDLGADYRSWVIAHGQSAYDAVVADPDALRAFPDAEAGCGLGEPFGDAAASLYLERTGLRAREADLPTFWD